MPNRRLSQARRKRHEEAVDWVLQSQESAPTGARKAALEAWLDQSPENRKAFAEAERLLGDARSAIESDPDLADHQARPARPLRNGFGGLGILALLLGGIQYFDGLTRLRADVYAGPAEQPVIELADGSTVHLNASSAIAIDIDTTGRRVRLLSGEAFFEIAPDPSRPFAVDLGDARVTALGTAFNIRRDRNETLVAVTEHAVRIDPDADRDGLVLHEGERIGLLPDGRVSAVEPIDPQDVLAWRDGKLVLDNAPLSYLAEELDRRFRGRIVLASRALADRRVSGTIMVSDTRDALAFLRDALGIRSTHLGAVILLTAGEPG